MKRIVSLQILEIKNCSALLLQRGKTLEHHQFLVQKKINTELSVVFNKDNIFSNRYRGCVKSLNFKKMMVKIV